MIFECPDCNRDRTDDAGEPCPDCGSVKVRVIEGWRNLMSEPIGQCDETGRTVK